MKTTSEHARTIGELSGALASGETSSSEIVERSLVAIREKDADIHAFLSVFDDDARTEAAHADTRRSKRMGRGPLDGIPVAVKDNILVRGNACTAGSRMLGDYIAVEDATVVKKLRDAGAILIGKTNLDEFAMGSSTESSAFGPTKNPVDPTRVPGGSSGGSAAAVASGMVPAALGSDTGGSIRQPASFCGIVGMKPTYGRVSRYGLLAMASSLDQIGPMAMTVDDAELLFSVLCGPDPKDQTTVAHPYEPDHAERRLRIGIPKQAWGEGIDDAVRDAVMGTVRRLEERGASVREIDLPWSDEALAVYYVLMPCEVSANMSRYDGMRYGIRVTADSLKETVASSRRQGLGAEVRRRILLGTFALSHGYFDAYYLQAKKVQTLIRTGYEQAFRDVDVVVTPTTPTVAFTAGEFSQDPLQMYLQDVFTVSANVAGIPAISVPSGAKDGLPVGLQLMGPWFKEASLFAAARMCEDINA